MNTRRTTRSQSNNNVTNNNTNNNNITNKGKTKKKAQKSADIIRQNQPLKFRQTQQQKDKQKETQFDYDDNDEWEDGSSLILEKNVNQSCSNDNNDDENVNVGDQRNGVTIEFDALPESSTKKKRVRRVTAEDKEVAELVHKVHLLCLIARGRLVDAACDDPLIQAALLSLVPSHLLKISEAFKVTVKDLTPLVSWFHQNFHVKSPGSLEKPFHSALAYALETHGGSPEEVAALSVALFRALNVTTRFVSILDVASLKPEADTDELSYLDSNKERRDVFDSSTPMVSKMDTEGTSSARSSLLNGDNARETSVTDEFEAKLGDLSRNITDKDSSTGDQLRKLDQSSCDTENVADEDKHPKRKGDLEFEMQLQMAMAATSVETPNGKSVASTGGLLSSPINFSSPLKKIKIIAEESRSPSHVISTAIGSRKVGAPLYWAEVYCSGENMTGKWVHIDAVNAIIDGELKVEVATAACKTFLRYVVAFAGHGAKDVTRRYCAKWYKISPKRINSEWWDAVLSPLKELESRATGGIHLLHSRFLNSSVKGVFNHVSQTCDSVNMNVIKDHEKPSTSSSVCNRSDVEDMELATRALTEPLPTNQQAYRNHPLYAIEKWLTKYQILHPKGPVLGFCSGHAVYPRTCVQTLHTKERWLREGLQVRENELPSKTVKSSFKNRRGQVSKVENSAEVVSDDVTLFGKWQTEPLCLPPAVNGIVPKNERGQVDVWSEKCLPPGTVHLRLPRLVPVAKRLGINFAPAMVGFDFRNGRSVPVYEGIVVCTEFREAILEAYTEEEQRREEEEKKRDERQALSRWYQLLSSMITRQRLNNTYMNNLESETISNASKSKTKSARTATTNVNENATPRQDNTHATKIRDSELIDMQNHEHAFLTDDESVDEESMTRTKRCRCGVSIQVEEL